MIQPNGTGHLSYGNNSMDITLTSVSNGVASGSITATSDPNYHVGESISLQITPGSPNGQLLQQTIGGEQKLPMCDSVAQSTHQCGA